MQVSEAVDAALDQLDPDGKDLLIRRYLQGNTQQQIAEALGADQSTISRRLAKAIEDVRAHLLEMGVACTVPAVQAVLDSAASVKAPPAVLASAANSPWPVSARPPCPRDLP